MGILQLSPFEQWWYVLGGVNNGGINGLPIGNTTTLEIYDFYSANQIVSHIAKHGVVMLENFFKGSLTSLSLTTNKNLIISMSIHLICLNLRIFFSFFPLFGYHFFKLLLVSFPFNRPFYFSVQ